MPPKIRPTTRYDRATGLFVPAFTDEERREKRSRAMHLLQAHMEGKASMKEQAELAKIDDDLYGPGSGWQEDPLTRAHAEALGGQVLKRLQRTGALRTTADVLRGGSPDGVWVDATDIPGQG